MRHLIFGLFTYIFIVLILFHDYMYIYVSLLGILSACLLSGIGLGNVLGAISLYNQERKLR